MAKYLITGGAGFIGSNYLNLMVKKYPLDYFVCLDSLTYASNLKSIESLMNLNNFKFIKGDIRDNELIDKLFKEEKFDYCINFAAETHVDNSIKNPNIFFETNVLGTLNLLNASLKYNLKRFHQVSTDEVYGDLALNSTYSFKEDDKLNPSSPYSASKASADLLVLSFYRTYGLDVTISRCSNNFGKFQNKEKLIPLVINKIINNQKIPVYGKGLNIRDWIYVDDHNNAIDLIIKKGKKGNIYNIGMNNELSNIDLIKKILELTHSNKNLISFVKDRKGHDLRYSLNITKIKEELGWNISSNFEAKLEETIYRYLKKE